MPHSGSQPKLQYQKYFANIQPLETKDKNSATKKDPAQSFGSLKTSRNEPNWLYSKDTTVQGTSTHTNEKELVQEFWQLKKQECRLSSGPTSSPGMILNQFEMTLNSEYEQEQRSLRFKRKWKPNPKNLSIAINSTGTETQNGHFKKEPYW